MTRQGHKGVERVGALDGIRGVAILLVLMFHISGQTPDAGVWRTMLLPFHVGWIGVDLFFVLSGFLITGILLDSKSRPDFFKRFYLRRSLRIFPLYYLALVLIIVAQWVGWLSVSAETQRTGWQTDLALWTYSTNILIAIKQQWESVAPHLRPLWSLAVEEQFYILWAPLIWLLDRKWIMRCCVLILLGAPLLRALVLGVGGSPVIAYVLTPCRLDPLAAGALVAVYLRGAPHARSRLAFAILGLSAAVGLGIILLLQGNFYAFSFSVLVVGLSLGALLFASVIGYVMLSGRDNLVTQILSWRALQVLGIYSYGLYIYQSLTISGLNLLFQQNVTLRALAPHVAFPLWVGIFAVLTAPIVWISYHWFEKPMMNLRERWATVPDGAVESKGRWLQPVTYTEARFERR